MANVFSSLGTIPIMETVQGMLQRQQNIRNSEILGQERQQLMQIRQQEMQERENTRKALLLDLQGGLQSQIDKSTLPSENDSPIMLARKQVKDLTQQFQQANALAVNLAKGEGDPALATHYSDKAKGIQSQLTAAIRELRQEESGLAKSMSNLAASTTADNFDSNMQRFREIDPRFDKKYTFDRDFDGNPIFGPTTQRTMNTIRDEGRSAEDQTKDKERIEEAARKKSESESLIEERKAQAHKADVEAARDQIKLNRLKAGLPETPSKRESEPEKESDYIKKAANQEPTEAMVKAAKASVDAYVSEKYPNMKKDSTMNAFAQDVATRTNTIRADALARGNTISIEDARQQAMDILGQFLKTTDPVSHWLKDDDPGKVMYRRSGVAPAKTETKSAPAKTPTASQPTTADDYLRSIGMP